MHVGFGAMRFVNRGFLSPTFIFPMAAVGLLAVAFVYYYFPARSRREASVNELAFRELGALGDLIQNRIVNYGTVLEQWAKVEVASSLGFADQVPDLHPAQAGEYNLKTLSVNTRFDKGHVLLRFQYDKHAADIQLETLV